MRLKTKLVLAITGLVFLIVGLLSLVYVSHLVDAAIQQSYDSNRMVAKLVRFSVAECADDGAERPDSSIPMTRPGCTNWSRQAIQDSPSCCRATMDSANDVLLDTATTSTLRMRNRAF